MVPARHELSTLRTECGGEGGGGDGGGVGLAARVMLASWRERLPLRASALAASPGVAAFLVTAACGRPPPSMRLVRSHLVSPSPHVRLHLGPGL